MPHYRLLHHTTPKPQGTPPILRTFQSSYSPRPEVASHYPVFDATRLIFDVSRQNLLGYQLLDIQLGQPLAHGSTLSTLRLRPNEIVEWTTFTQDFWHYYLHTVTDDDKSALIAPQQSFFTTLFGLRGFLCTREDDIKNALNSVPFNLHRVATSSNNGQPRPSDHHSQIDIYPSQAMGYGQPDYIFTDATRQ
jgi:hypothetical protein